MKIAIAFLTVYPLQETIDFANEIALQTDYDVYIICDSMKEVPLTTGCKIIQLSDSICLEAGYEYCNMDGKTTSIKKNPTAWDKCFYYFCELNSIYSRLWVFEDDVFIPSIRVLKSLIEDNKPFDLVTAENFYRNPKDNTWYWPQIEKSINGPHFNSMVCACGISRALLNIIKERVDKQRGMFYVEAMLNTLAIQNRLTLKCAPALKSIVWMGEWGLDEFILLPDNLFHPVKEIRKHPEMRKQIAQAIKNQYKPTKELPAFLSR